MTSGTSGGRSEVSDVGKATNSTPRALTSWSLVGFVVREVTTTEHEGVASGEAPSA